MSLSVLLQVNSVNCNTSWKINLFMQFRDHLEEVLKGVSMEAPHRLPLPDRLFLFPASSHTRLLVHICLLALYSSSLPPPHRDP
jgi:hypothetical protein